MAKTLLNKDVIERVCKARANGHTLSEASAYAGVSLTSLVRWMSDADAIAEGKPRPSGLKTPSPTMLSQLKSKMGRANFAASELAISTIRAAMDGGDWRAAAWWLEKAYPMQWGNRQPAQVELTAPKPLKIEVVWTGSGGDTDAGDSD